MNKENQCQNTKESSVISDFSGNFREVLRDTMLAHTAVLLIFSMYAALLIKQPENMLLGVTFAIVFGLALIVIITWLIMCLRGSYKKMIHSVLLKRLCIIFHAGVFETLLIASLIYAVHSIVTSLAH